MLTVFLVLFVLIVVLYVVAVANMSPQQRQQHFEATKWGGVRPAMICPHCQTQGKVRTKPFTKKAGISGGKATAALVTGGLSVLATGLSRKEHQTQAHCGNCQATWTF
jgi:hypothetical protein